MTKEQVKEIIKSTPSEVLADIVPQEKSVVKSSAEIDSYITLRQEFIQKVNAICVEGKDYHIIQGKKSLAKGGAEKIASIFHWTAKFEKDTESLEMLGDIKGLVAFKCTLMNGVFVGEGRGAAMLAKNSNDPNKTLKMAQKSAFIDAVLRASGLSDFYTQDLEDMPSETISHVAPQHVVQPTGKQPSEKQKMFIKKLCTEKQITQSQLKELAVTYKGDPSGLIDYLLNYRGIKKETQEPQELPVIQQEMSEEDQKLVDSIPF